MIQQEYKNNVKDMSGEITSTGFTIEANASVYAMLTQNIYNDPILAVVREWSTNACDACIAADVPIEYDVHLPTPAEPQFFVRDYGTGLPPEDIVGLFSNLGASTKRKSNLFNGTLGIGRMAGLAVGDAFSIESYYEGTLYSYVVSMQDGIPVTLHLGNTPTTERNGLKLSVAVENRSFSYYREKAEAIYKYFDYKPNINDKSVNMKLDTETMIADDWYVQNAAANSYSYNYDNFVVMSQVLYKIPQTSEVKTHDFRRLVLKAPAGAVTFNPGRESLTLDKKTVSYLNTAFNKVKEDYVAKSTTALAVCENDAELIKCFSNIISNAPHSLISNIDPKPFMSQELQHLLVETTYNTCGINIAETTDFTAATSNALHLTSKPSYYKTARDLDRRGSISALEFFKAKHVIVDMKTKYKAALNQYFKNELAIFWQRTKEGDLDLAITEAKRYLEALGISYEIASTIAKTEVVKKHTLAREGLYVSDIAYGGRVGKSQCMSAEKITEGTYLYLPLKHTTPVIKDVTIEFIDYFNLYEYLRKNRTVPKIYGVAKKYQDIVEDCDNWLDFETYIKDEIRKQEYVVDDNTLKGHVPQKVTAEDFKDYPSAIQHYVCNLIQYRSFIGGSQCIFNGSNLEELLKRLGATKKKFEPLYPVTEQAIKETYELTYKGIFASGYRGMIDGCYNEDYKKLAKLEEFYEIHSSE